jgi:hypothetical protein
MATQIAPWTGREERLNSRHARRRVLALGHSRRSRRPTDVVRCFGVRRLTRLVDFFAVNPARRRPPPFRRLVCGN